MSRIAYSPECLSVSLGGKCNLRCAYCYNEDHGESEGGGDEAAFLGAAAAAARLVAAACRRRGLPLSFGFQGGGEPLSAFERLAAAYAVCREAAAAQSIGSFSFITTNGASEPEKLEWLAERFDRICLSVDGPPAAQDRQRVFPSGRGTSDLVARAMRVLAGKGIVPECRVTVTSLNDREIPEAVEFLVKEFGVSTIRIEPAYSLSKKDLRPDPEAFCEGYAASLALAARLGARASYSGFRPGEAHRTYCSAEKRVLFLTSRGTASQCMFREAEDPDSVFSIGSVAPRDGEFRLDQAKAAALRSRIDAAAASCGGCGAAGHCCLGCPDHCAVASGDHGSMRDSIRCRINRILARSPGTAP